MTSDDAGSLLEKAAVFRHPCDLDLFLFFVRHPRSLLSSESLATFLGYELKQIADSLEILLGADLIRRTQTSAHAARLYVLVTDRAEDPCLRSILELASTRKGRILLKRALTSVRGGESSQSSLIGARPGKAKSNAVAARSFPLRPENGGSVRKIRRRRGGRDA